MRIPLAALALPVAVALSLLGASTALAQRQALPVHGITADLPVPESGKWMVGGTIDVEEGRAVSELLLQGDAGVLLRVSASLRVADCPALLSTASGDRSEASALVPELAGEIALAERELWVCSPLATPKSSLLLRAEPRPDQLSGEGRSEPQESRDEPAAEPEPNAAAPEPGSKQISAPNTLIQRAAPALVALQKAFGSPNQIATVPAADDTVKVTRQPALPVRLPRTGLHWTPPDDGSVWALRDTGDPESNEDLLVLLAPVFPHLELSVATIGLSSPDTPSVCAAILDSRRQNQAGASDRSLDRPPADYSARAIEWQESGGYRLTLCGENRHNQIVTVTATSGERLEDLTRLRGVLASLIEAPGERGSEISRRMEASRPKMTGGGWVKRYVADIGYQSHLAYAGESDDFGDSATILSVGFAAHLTVGNWIGYSGGIDLSVGSTFGSSFAYDFKVAPLGVAFFAGPEAIGSRWYGRLDGLTDRIDRSFSVPLELFADGGRLMGSVELNPLGGPGRSDDAPSELAPFGNEMTALLLFRTGRLDGETRNLHVGLTYREVVGTRMGGVVIGFSRAGTE